MHRLTATDTPMVRYTRTIFPSYAFFLAPTKPTIIINNKIVICVTIVVIFIIILFPKNKRTTMRCPTFVKIINLGLLIVNLD